MRYLRGDQILYDNSEYSVAAAMAERNPSAAGIQPASPSQTLNEFPRRVEALVHHIVFNSGEPCLSAGRPVSVTPLPTGQGATPAEVILYREYNDGRSAKELGAVDHSKDRLWREIEFEYRGIGKTNAIPLSDCIVCTRPFTGRNPGGYMASWATFGVRKTALAALAKRVGLAIGNRPTGLTVVRYDMGDDDFHWFNIPFRGSGFSFVRGDNGAGIPSGQVPQTAGAHNYREYSSGRVPCTLLLDVGCSVVVPSGTAPDEVDIDAMWGLHLGMLKCILKVPSGGDSKPRSRDTSGFPPRSEAPASEPPAPTTTATDTFARTSDLLETGPSRRRGFGRSTRSSRTLSVVSDEGYGEIPSLKSWKFWWCCSGLPANNG